MTRVWIRRGDVGDLWALGRAWGPPAARNRVTESFFARNMRAGRQELWVAQTEARPVGRVHVIWSAADTHLADGIRRAYLCALEVDPAFRGVGVGGALVRRALRRVGQRGFTEVCVGVESGAERLKAVYERWGFTYLVLRETVDEFSLDERGRPREVAPFEVYLKELPDPASADRPRPPDMERVVRLRPGVGIFYPIFYGLVAWLGALCSALGSRWAQAAALFGAAASLTLWAVYSATEVYELTAESLVHRDIFSSRAAPLARIHHVALTGGPPKRVLTVMVGDADGLVKRVAPPIELERLASELIRRAAWVQGLPERDLTLVVEPRRQPARSGAR